MLRTIQSDGIVAGVEPLLPDHRVNEGAAADGLWRQTACGGRRPAALSAVISGCSSRSEKSQMPRHLRSDRINDITRHDGRVREAKPQELKPDHLEVIWLSSPKGRPLK